MIESKRKMLILLELGFILSIVSAGIIPAREIKDDTPTYRLDKHIVPTNYEITLTVDNVGEPSFTGKVIISADVVEEADQITLHKADNIEITTMKLVIDTDPEIDIKDYSTFNPTTEILTIKKEGQKMEAEKKVTITIEYKAKFPEGMYGFYKSTYEDTEKNKKVLLVTQFEPTHARKAFPCFDEPEYKATFSLTLVVPEGYGALSNSQGNYDPAETPKKVTFEATPQMSTYLLAFIVYEEDSYTSSKEVESSDKKIKFKTWGRKEQIDGKYETLSLDDGPQYIEKMETFTSIEYKFTDDVNKKIDQVAIPDFSAGAMENWGLITYRDVDLMFNSDENTEAAKIRASQTIAHELSHQWFGNLVTTEWWDTIWLNEGFARFFEYYLADQVHSDWRMMERFVVDEQRSALLVDASESSTPLTNTVNSPEEVTANFGTISYSKGGSVLRMFANTLGLENFQKALIDYLTNNNFKSGTPDILFDSFINFKSEDDIDKLYFESWTKYPGFPLITVKRADTAFTLNQERFLVDKTNEKDESLIYHVRVSLLSDSENENKNTQVIWLKEATASVTFKTNKWYLVKSDGYFRVNYDEQNWASLTEELQTETETDSGKSIEALERAVLIDNAMNLAKINKLSYSTALTLLSYIEDERDYIPWSAAFSNLDFIYHMLHETEKNNEDYTIEVFIRKMVNKIYTTLGFKNEGEHIDKIFRANVLSWACRVGHEECISQSVDLLQKYLNENEKVNSNLRSIVYCYGVQNNDDLWIKLWKKLQETDDASERSLLISALGCNSNTDLLSIYLYAALGGTVRPQDIGSAFSSVYSNPKGLDIVLDFLNYNWMEIDQRTSTLMNGMSNIFRGVAQYINKQGQVDLLGKIIEQIDENSEIRKQAVISQRTGEKNVEWIKTYKTSVLEELEKIAPKPVTEAPTANTTTTNETVTEAPAGKSTTTNETVTEAPAAKSTTTNEPAINETTTQGSWSLSPAFSTLTMTVLLSYLAYFASC